MKIDQGIFTFLLISVFMTIAVILYMVVTKLVRTEDATRNGEEILSYAAIVALIIATIKIFLLAGYSYIGGDGKTYDLFVTILAIIGIISLPILIGLGYSRLRDSSDWQYNQSTETMIKIALGLSFIPIAIMIVRFLWYKFKSRRKLGFGDEEPSAKTVKVTAKATPATAKATPATAKAVSTPATAKAVSTPATAKAVSTPATAKAVSTPAAAPVNAELDKEYMLIQPKIFIEKGKIKVLGYIYDGGNTNSYLENMIKAPGFDRTLFIFDESLEDYINFHRKGKLYEKGIQKYKYPKNGKVKAASIPVRNKDGLFKGTASDKVWIKDSFEYIKLLLNTGAYEEIAYSSNKDRTLRYRIPIQTRSAAQKNIMDYINQKLLIFDGLDFKRYSNSDEMAVEIAQIENIVHPDFKDKEKEEKKKEERKKEEKKKESSSSSKLNLEKIKVFTYNASWETFRLSQGSNDGKKCGVGGKNICLENLYKMLRNEDGKFKYDIIALQEFVDREFKDYHKKLSAEYNNFFYPSQHKNSTQTIIYIRKELHDFLGNAVKTTDVILGKNDRPRLEVKFSEKKFYLVSFHNVHNKALDGLKSVVNDYKDSNFILMGDSNIDSGDLELRKYLANNKINFNEKINTCCLNTALQDNLSINGDENYAPDKKGSLKFGKFDQILSKFPLKFDSTKTTLNGVTSMISDHRPLSCTMDLSGLNK